MKKVCVIGHFCFGENLLNGQTIKTKIITDGLKTQLGDNEVVKIDTHGGKRTLFKAPFQVFKAFICAKNIIILPAHNGLRVYVPLLLLFSKLLKNRKLHYIVIGGWLPNYVRDKKFLSKLLKKFNGIYVETNSMKKALEVQGFNNVVVMPNCKDLKPLSETELVYPTGEPYKLCTFSRVIKEKGIEEAVKAVKAVNEYLGRTVYLLDIFGQVDPNQIEWFEKLRKEFPPYINYGGFVPFDKSVGVLKNYFALLFPSYYDGEGFAGTILDAFASGIPVIATNWKYNEEIIRDRVDGFIYNYQRPEKLRDILIEICSNTTMLIKMKSSCVARALSYLPEFVIGEFMKYL